MPVVVTALAALALAGCAIEPPTVCTIDRSAVSASVVERGSPLADLERWPSDVLTIANRDADDWHRVDVALTGVVITNDRRRQTTGRFTSREQKAVARGEVVPFELAAFENSRGSRWMTATMTVTDVELTVLRGGVQCRATVAVASP